MNYKIGPRIGIDGEAEFRKQIRDINYAFRAMEAQTKAVEAQFALTGNEAEKLSESQKILEKQQDALKEREKLLTDAVEKANAKWGEKSIKVQHLQAALLDNKATLLGVEKELETTKDRLSGAGQETVDYEGEVRKLDSAYKVLESQTKAVNAEFAASGDEQEKLEKLSGILGQKVEQLQAKQKLLAEATQKAGAEFGEDSTEAQKLKAALIDTQATLTGVEKELKDTEDRLSGAGEEMEEFSDEMEDAGSSAIDFGDLLKANLLSDAIMNGLDKLGDLARDFGSGMLDAAAEVRAQNSQFSQTFGEMAEQAKESLDSISDNTNIAASRMQSSYTMVYAFAKTAGMTSAQALDLASRSLNAAADSAAYYDKSVEEATQTLQSFLKGNYANDAALGIAATETTRNAAANQKYAKSFQELTEAQKVDVLLSMVEAGNKASGAFGQAARESEEWTNVTGEMEEAWRQLQAAVGEPFLEELIPVVTKVTDKLKEAAKSGDLEEFAEKLAGGLGWIIDHGDEVAKSAAMITAAIGGFKVASSAYTGIMSLNTALGSLAGMKQTVASFLATTASGANIIGGTAAAVTAMVAAIALAPEQVDETREAVNALNETAQEAAKAISTAQKALTDDQVDIQSRMAVAGEYLNTLKALEDQGIDTAEAQAEYDAAVASLRELLPEVNIQIDEQTGLLEGGTQALVEQIRQWEKLAYVQAYQQRTKELIGAQMDAKLALEEQNKALNELETKLKAANVRLSQATKEWKKVGDETDTAASTFGACSDEVFAAQKEVDALVGSMKALEAGIADNERVIQDADNALAGYQDQLKEYEEQAQEAAYATDDLGEAVEKADQTGFPNLSEEYDDLKKAAEESIRKQIGLFEDLSSKAAPTFAELLQGLESQQKAFREYADNIQRAMERGIDQGLVAKLSDGSTESMLTLQTLANATDEEIAKMNAAWESVGVAAKEYGTVVATMKTDAIREVQGMVERMKSLAPEIVDGLVNGVEQNKHKFTAAMYEMAQEGSGKFQSHYIIHSPSGLMENMAGFIPKGAARGVEKNTAVFANAMEAMTEEPFADALQRFQAAMDSTAASVSGMQLDGVIESAGWRLSEAVGVTNNTTNNHSRTVNLGGINVYITAPEGMDVQELAQLVSQEINDKTMREVAAYGY